MMRIREGEVAGLIITLCPFHSALEILEEVQQSNPVDSQEHCSDPEQKYSAFRAQPGRSSRKLWKKNS
jgi:hypothetical protein